MIFSPENIVSSIAAVLTTVSFLPQVFKTVKTKDTKGISLLMYILFTIGVMFWTVFAFLINSYPAIIANIIVFFLALVILTIKIINCYKGNE